MGEPSRALMAAKLPAAPMTMMAIVGRVLLEEVDEEHGDAAADGDERRLGAEHDTQAQGHEGGRGDAVQMDRRRGAAPAASPLDGS